MIKIVAGAILYFLMGTATIGFSAASGEQLCNSIHPEPGFSRGICYQTNAYQSVLKGMFWPVYVPFQIGAKFV